MEANANPAPADVSLEALVPARLQPPRGAEPKLLRAAPAGEWALCGPNFDDKDTANDPSKADEAWGPERVIRAEIIRWLCVDRAARDHVDPKGIRVYGAKITGKLDLSYVTVPFPLIVQRCRLTDDADLYQAQLPLLSLQGSWVRAINADRIEVKGAIFLRNAFHAEGEVRLLDAQIGGTLECDGSTFRNPSGDALNADRIEVKGDIFLRNDFHAEGEVVLLDAQIGGQLSCIGGTFKNPSGNALNADRIEVKGSVFLRDGFLAEGVVRLLGAQIGGDLESSGGRFSELNADAAAIQGYFHWWNIKNPAGTKLDLRNASAGSIRDDQPSWPKPGKLILDGFVYGRFTGDTTPKDAHTRLDWLDRQDPFTPQPYRQLAKVLREAGDEDGAVEVLEKMECLRRKTEFQRLKKERRRLRAGWELFESEALSLTVGYGYDPLRAVYWIGGLSGLAWILYRRSYLAGNMVPKDKDACNSFKYDGQSPEGYTAFEPLIYAVENSLPLVKLGQEDTWQPEPDAESALSQRKGWPTSLGRRRVWKRWRWLQRILVACGMQPDPNPENPLRPLQRLLVFCGLQPHPNRETPPSQLSRWLTSPRFLRWFLWIQILLGWILATLFAAGVTGIIHKD